MAILYLYPMIYFTQLIYLKPGGEEAFQEFESMAMPLIPKFKGTLLLRLRPGHETIIEKNMDAPYEGHLVSFPSDADFQDFMKDPGRKKFLHLKENSIESSVLIKGTKL